MNTEDKKEIKEIVVGAINEALNQIIIPQFDNVYKEIAGSEQRLRKEISKSEQRVTAKIEYEVQKLRDEFYKLEAKVDRIEQMIYEDTRVSLQEIEDIKTEITRMNKRIKHLELARK